MPRASCLIRATYEWPRPVNLRRARKMGMPFGGRLVVPGDTRWIIHVGNVDVTSRFLHADFRPSRRSRQTPDSYATREKNCG